MVIVSMVGSGVCLVLIDFNAVGGLEPAMKMISGRRHEPFRSPRARGGPDHRHGHQHCRQATSEDEIIYSR